MGTTIKATNKHQTKPDYVQATEAAAALVVAAGEVKIFIGSSRLTKMSDAVEQLRACADALRDSNNPVPGDSADLVTNGGFAADTDWTKGTGWTIAGGVASSDGTQVGDSDLTEDALVLVAGESYQVTFTVSNYVAGNVTPVAGGVEGTDRAADGTFVETIVAGAGDLDIRADADFVGDIDDVSVIQVTGGEVIATLEEGLGSQDVVVTNQFDLPTFSETMVAVLIGEGFARLGTSSLFDAHIEGLIYRALEDVLVAA